jgi:hypothetical protein
LHPKLFQFSSGRIEESVNRESLPTYSHIEFIGPDRLQNVDDERERYEVAYVKFDPDTLKYWRLYTAGITGIDFLLKNDQDFSRFFASVRIGFLRGEGNGNQIVLTHQATINGIPRQSPIVA